MNPYLESLLMDRSLPSSMGYLAPNASSMGYLAPNASSMGYMAPAPPRRSKLSDPPIKGWKWPRDPRPGPRGRGWFRNRMSAWSDVLTGKGPDVFVGRLDNLHHNPSRPRWSRWRDVHGDPNGSEGDASAFWGADRGTKRYDFHTRRYTEWHPDMWSDVEYCQNRHHRRIPLMYADAGGAYNGLGQHHFNSLGEPACWDY